MSEARVTLADKVLRYLTDQGGVVVSESGRGITARMAEAVGADLGVLNGVLARMERNGVIVREVRGRRTYRVALSQHAAGGHRGLAPRLPDGAGRSGYPRHQRAFAAGSGATATVDGGGEPDLDWIRHELAGQADKIIGLQQMIDELGKRLSEFEAGHHGPGRDSAPQEQGSSRFLRRRSR